MIIESLGDKNKVVYKILATLPHKALLSILKFISTMCIKIKKYSE